MTTDRPATGDVPGRLLTLAEAARVLGVSIKTVRRFYANATLPIVRVGRQIRVASADLEHFIAARRRG